ncbi:unnamed protein product, partial [Allacma fusca]
SRAYSVVVVKPEASFFPCASIPNGGKDPKRKNAYTFVSVVMFDMLVLVGYWLALICLLGFVFTTFFEKCNHEMDFGLL